MEEAGKMATTDKSPSSELPEPSVGDSLSRLRLKAGIDLNNSKDVSTCSDLNSSSDHSDYESFEYDLGQLSNLPPEIVHCILGYLDARFVLTRLSLVCKTFYHLLKDTTTWRLRVVKLSEKSYPVFPEDEDLDWPLACIQREEFHNLWTNTETVEHFTLTEAHYAAVDCVHLTEGGRYCYSGSRDRSIQMWDLAKLDAENREESINASKVASAIAHKGWIWHISSNKNKLCSSSWDCYLKIWDINTELTELHKLKGPSAFLCSVFLDDLIIAGSYDKRIYAYDPRDSCRSVTKWFLHRGPVLCLAADDKYMISGSEDQSLKVFDRRADKVLIEHRFKSFPMSLSYGYNQLWTGHKSGQLKVTYPNDGLFDVVKTYDSGHSGKLTGVVHNLGGLCTCATDKQIKIHAPTDPIDTLTTLAHHAADVTAVAMQNNVLASAGGDVSIGIWRPKNWSV
ncbi:putative F-box/WD repeat-containing protein 9 [Apostichopus japonicus]|uniref:Putative F-box/WD repeat-containing protein 9 n=1 Tax=Stichopus japonicus TaxID=307972 RepID=A0A2G8KH29_STIJA|nr:putative F-box/WD repeat-containing protein 9 [Apostichopus japonicus]